MGDDGVSLLKLDNNMVSYYDNRAVSVHCSIFKAACETRSAKELNEDNLYGIGNQRY